MPGPAVWVLVPRAPRGVVLSNSLAVSARWRWRVAARRPDDVAAGLVHKTQAAASAPRLAMALLIGLAFLAVSVWFGIGAMPAQAQSVTLVANIEQATADYTAAPVGWFSGSNDINWVQAQSFTTGSNARGYRLTSMTIAVYKGDPDAALAVGIYTDSLGEPGEELYRLRGSVGSVGVTKFYAPRGAHLDADTEYFLVLINDDGEHHYFVADVTGSDQEDAVLALGFSIGNSRLEKWVSDSDPSYVWEELPQALKMAANGFAVVTEDTTETGRDELTAHFQDMPEAHDGQSSFKFALLFNQEVDVSYRDMRDHVLQISEGTVKNARRLEPPSDRSWEYTVRPNSDTDMTIVLSVTSDCAAVGAVCTEDGKRLSNGLTATVSGPGSVLTAWFENVPESHDGSTAFTFELHFGEDIPGLSYKTVAGGLFEVTGANMTGARRLTKGSNQGWQVTVEPSGTDDIAITLPARACGETAAICVAGNRALSEGVSATVQMERQSAQQSEGALPARFENVPDSHDGSTPFTFELHFSENIPDLSYRTVRDSVLDVRGGSVTKARRLTKGSNQGWAVTVEPAGGDLTIALPARACGETGAICAADGRPLSSGIAATTVVRLVEFKVQFGRQVLEHDGESPVPLIVYFTRVPANVSEGTFLNGPFDVSGGRITAATRVDADYIQTWRLTIQPASLDDIDVWVRGTESCDEAYAVCTADGQKLAVGPGATIRGPAALSVADAEVREASGAVLDFTVTLSRERPEATTVDWATSDDTATAGTDYTATSGTLTFAAGETSKTVSVLVLDDAHDEGSETLTFTLSNPSGAAIDDGEAIGTITNTDPMPQAWIARFGRTVGTHVTDAVGERLRESPGQGSHVTVGGYRLPLARRAGGAGNAPAATGGLVAGERAQGAKLWGPLTTGTTSDDGAEPQGRLASLVTGVAGMLGLSGVPAGGMDADAGTNGGPGWDPWLDGPGADQRLGQAQSLNLDLRRMLLGSSFRLNLGTTDRDALGALRLTAWGRVAGTRFDGRDGDLTLDGDVLTGMAGVDGEWDRWLVGLAVAHSHGAGSYTMSGIGDNGRGELDKTLTSIHPYLRYAVTDRLDVWGLVGYGWGDLSLEQGTGGTLETDTNLVMGSLGGRGILLAASESGGFELATRTDAMLTRTTSDAVTGANGNLASAEADAHRLRLVLEGSRGFTWPEGRTLTPTMEVGLRHDWGDAETGFGLELGGRVQYADPSHGLTVELAVRGLLAHEDSDYEEWGGNGTIRVAPGAGGQGLALTLSPSWGAASGGVDGLWSRQTTTGLAPQGTRSAPTGRLNAEVSYGVPAPFGTGLLTPYAGTVLTDGAARTYRVGTRLELTGGWTTGVTLSLEGQRQEPVGSQPINQGLQFQAAWGF